jgi:murein L,D-transpeptidase YcbB/YkuD
MSILRTISAVGTALAATVSADATGAPPADPATVRALLAEIGLPADGLRRFQAQAGLVTDGVAGPRTMHVLARYVGEIRELRALGFAA